MLNTWNREFDMQIHAQNCPFFVQGHWFWVVSDTLLSWIYFNPQLFAEGYENPINFIF